MPRHTDNTWLERIAGYLSGNSDGSIGIRGDVSVVSASSMGDGRKTVASAGTAEALSSSTSCKSVNITAETDNTGVIAVGGSTVVAALGTRRGVPLSAGDSVTIDVDNLADIFIDSTANGEGVTYAYTI